MCAASSPLKAKALAKPGDVIQDPKGDESKMEQLREIFEEGDANNDGYHSISEIQNVLIQNSKASLIDGFNRADKNKDGLVSQSEYLVLFPYKSKQDFRETDTNHDGRHSLDEQLNHFASTKEFKKEMENALVTAKTILKHDDKDKDGKLSEKEFMAHSSTLLQPLQDEIAFHRADLNKDGFHSVDEITTEIMHMAGFDKQPDGQFIEAGVKDAFRSADTNNDNVVSKAEYLKAYKNATAEDFKRSDANGDGYTTLKEAMNHQSKSLTETLKLAMDEANQYVRESDKNADGKLDLEEKNDAVHRRNKIAQKEHHEELFKLSDTNGDGFHDEDEIKHVIIRQSGYTKLAAVGDDQLHYFLPEAMLHGFRHADADNNQVVTEQEFLKAYKDHAQASQHFKEADHNGDGEHTLDEMAKSIFESEAFKKLHAEAEEQSKRLIKQADSNGDGKVSNKEFLAHILLLEEGNNTSREL